MVAQIVPFPQKDDEAEIEEKFNNERFIQISAVIRDSDPAIWRRAIVPASLPLAALHTTLLALFNWSGAHSYRFCANDSFFDDPLLLNDAPPRPGDKRFSASDVPVGTVLTDPGSILDYVYDLGDSWDVEIECEGVLAGEQYPFLLAPVCVDGEGAGPLEDVGGIGSYEEFCEAVNDPSNPEYKNLREWAELEPDEEFDPDFFTPFDANEFFASVMIDQMQDEIVPSDPDELRKAYMDLLSEHLAMQTERVLDVINLFAEADEEFDD